MYANAHQFGAQHAALAFLAGQLTINNVEQCFAAITRPCLMIWGRPASAAQPHLPSSSSHVSVTQHNVARVQEDAPEVVVEDILNWQTEQTIQTEPIGDIPTEAPIPNSVAEVLEPVEVAEPVETSQSAAEPETVSAVESGPAATEAQEPEAVATEAGNVYEAYCVKCKVKRPIQNARKTVTKNGRNAIEGVCPVCGTRLFRFGAK
jgi:hypothetical protein